MTELILPASIGLTLLVLLAAWPGIIAGPRHPRREPRRPKQRTHAAPPDWRREASWLTGLDWRTRR